MNVPFLDLHAGDELYRDEMNAAIDRVLDSSWYILGPEVEAFEQEFAQYCGARYCVGVANGLEALQLILVALGIGPGDEVIVPANTYIATWLAITHAGATPIPVEPNENTLNIDVDRIEAAVTPRTRAIMPVHLYGRPADMQSIQAIAQRHGLAIVDDAAQAHGASINSQHVGSMATATAFSFYPSKNLGALGDGGAVTTNDEDLANRLRRLRHYGTSDRYTNPQIGFNSRLDELQAAILRTKLKHLDDWNASREAIARRYLESMQNDHLVLPLPTDRWHQSAWHLFVVRCRNRHAIMDHLEQAGIGHLIHYPVPPHLQGAYADCGYAHGSLPIAEYLAQEVLSLPISPCLTEEQVGAVINAVNTAPCGFSPTRTSPKF